MRRILLLLFLILNFILPFGLCDQPKLLTAGITMVPESFYGTWRVESNVIDSNSDVFKDKSLDIWNLSRTGDVITLYNIFNGAQAQITVNKADTKHVIFTKVGKQKNKELKDTVEIYISGEEFSGTDNIELRTYVDGKIIKIEKARYKIKGEKIAGGSIIK